MGLRYQHFEAIEKNAVLLAVLIAFMVSLGGLSEITPLFANAHAVKPAPGVKPYDPLRLAGRDIYVREGCYVCHSQMIRALAQETERYGPHSVAGESVYDRPFQWGSKRTGPDLARVGGKFSDEWHRLHLINPRNLVPVSNMPGYPWLVGEPIDPADIQARMRVLNRIGDPYTDAEIDSAPSALQGKTAMDALIAYLQGLGVNGEAGKSSSATPAVPARAAPAPAASREGS
jgi:cytochrome c oxidase cbb3-type subunit 2